MKRFTLLAAAGLFSMSLSAQEAKEEPKEEGFVFTTVWEKENTTCPKCTSYIKLILTVPMQQCALMEMYLSHKEVLSMM